MKMKIVAELLKGWNLVGIPWHLKDESKKASKLFDLKPGERIWHLDREAEKWIPTDMANYKVSIGLGYWVWKNESCNVEAEIENNPIFVPPTIPLKKGWNMIALVMNNHSVPVESAVGYMGDVADLVCTWNGSKFIFWFRPDGHNELEIMEPWKGYWINVLEDIVWI